MGDVFGLVPDDYIPVVNHVYTAARPGVLPFYMLALYLGRMQDVALNVFAGIHGLLCVLAIGLSARMLFRSFGQYIFVLLYAAVGGYAFYYGRSQYGQGFAALFFALHILFSVLYTRDGRKRWLVASGLSIGYTVSLHYSLLMSVPAALVFAAAVSVCLRRFSQARQVLKISIAGLAGCAVVFVGYVALGELTFKYLSELRQQYTAVFTSYGKMGLTFKTVTFYPIILFFMEGPVAMILIILGVFRVIVWQRCKDTAMVVPVLVLAAGYAGSTMSSLQATRTLAPYSSVWCILAGYGLLEVARWSRKINPGLGHIAPVFLAGVSLSWNVNNDLQAIQGMSAYRPIFEYVNKEYPDTKVAVHPNHFPELALFGRKHAKSCFVSQDMTGEEEIWNVIDSGAELFVNGNTSRPWISIIEKTHRPVVEYMHAQYYYYPAAAEGGRTYADWRNMLRNNPRYFSMRIYELDPEKLRTQSLLRQKASALDE